MTKEQKKYIRIGQAVCGITETILMFCFPVLMCNLAEIIANLF